MKFFDYTKLSFSALVEKIGKSRYFDLPAMLEEVLKRLQIMISEGGGITTLSGDFVNNTDPLNPTLDKGYKVYTALLTQSGTNAPVATVLENTLSGATWARVGEGSYTLTFETPLDLSKMYINGLSDFNGSSNIYLPISDGNTIKGYYNMYIVDSTVLSLGFQTNAFFYNDISALMGTSTLFLPEIRVYN